MIRKLLAILLRFIGIILFLPLLVISFSIFLLAIVSIIIYYGDDEYIDPNLVFILPDYIFKVAKKIENEKI